MHRLYSKLYRTFRLLQLGLKPNLSARNSQTFFQSCQVAFSCQRPFLVPILATIEIEYQAECYKHLKRIYNGKKCRLQYFKYVLGTKQKLFEIRIQESARL